MFKKLLLPMFLTVMLLGAGLYIGYKIFSPRHSTTVNSETVLTMLKSEGFLVTQSYVVNQIVEINKSTGSEFKDIFWRQAITASANVKVSSGVDLSQLSAIDIEVKRDSIAISLPPIETQSVELLGAVMLQNKQGILKKIFNNEDGYNEAVAKIQEEAKRAAEAVELRSDAESNAEKEMQKLLRYLYPGKEVVIRFKLKN